MVDACKSLPRSQGQDAGEGKENKKKEKKNRHSKEKRKSKVGDAEEKCKQSGGKVCTRSFFCVLASTRRQLQKTVSCQKLMGWMESEFTLKNRVRSD